MYFGEKRTMEYRYAKLNPFTFHKELFDNNVSKFGKNGFIISNESIALNLLFKTRDHLKLELAFFPGGGGWKTREKKKIKNRTIS